MKICSDLSTIPQSSVNLMSLFYKQLKFGINAMWAGSYEFGLLDFWNINSSPCLSIIKIMATN